MELPSQSFAGRPTTAAGPAFRPPDDPPPALPGDLADQYLRLADTRHGGVREDIGRREDRPCSRMGGMAAAHCSLDRGDALPAALSEANRPASGWLDASG